MKFFKTFLMMAMLIVFSCSAKALTLDEAYLEFTHLSHTNDSIEQSEKFRMIKGWLDLMPMQDTRVTYIQHSVNSELTTIYAHHTQSIINQLTEDQMVISGANGEASLYIFANLPEKENTDILILVNQPNQGIAYAIYGKVDLWVLTALKRANISFTPDKQILVYIPIIGF
ncbi:MAG: hypothetical protein K2J78_05695 [Muribaculaceae bacterium]|nr:hypothetical protein [Muribaculaceae bacterium]